MPAHPLIVSHSGRNAFAKELLIVQDVVCFSLVFRLINFRNDDEKFLVLDGQTLVNLELFRNSADGSSEHTLVKFLDHCVTPFG